MHRIERFYQSRPLNSENTKDELFKENVFPNKLNTDNKDTIN